MAQPVYTVFMMNFKEAWYQLSQQRRDELLGSITASIDAVGGEVVVMCDSSWASNQWNSFGLLKFPSVEALQQHREDTNRLDWPRYAEAFNLLGSEWRPPA